MCLRVIEKYPFCYCVYQIHGIDACISYGYHAITDKFVGVSFSCPIHSQE